MTPPDDPDSAEIERLKESLTSENIAKRPMEELEKDWERLTVLFNERSRELEVRIAQHKAESGRLEERTRRLASAVLGAATLSISIFAVATGGWQDLDRLADFFQIATAVSGAIATVLLFRRPRRTR